MSSTILKIIPTNPSYVADTNQQDKARSFLTGLFRDEQVEFTTSDTIEFIDQGENFESVKCNQCGKNLEMENWKTAMERASETQFADLTFVTPCCKITTSLNDLVYTSPAGFAQFVITIADAQGDLAEKDFRNLQEILGIGL